MRLNRAQQNPHPTRQPTRPGIFITAQAVDSHQVSYNLPVEFVGTVPSFTPVLPQEPFLTEIILKLPINVNAGDLTISINAHQRTSNEVLVAVKP